MRWSIGVDTARTGLDAGATVVVHGAAGMGKTVIAEEIVEQRSFVVGQCLAPLAHIAYHSLSHAFRRRFTGDVGDVADEVIASIGARVLWVEDAHWADRATVDVLRRLNGQVPILVTTRDEAGLHIGQTTALSVPPLGRRPARALARRLYPHLTNPTLDRFVTAAAGNPLLLRQLGNRDSRSPALVEAIRQRVLPLSAESLDVIGTVALFGRAAPLTVIGPCVADDQGLLLHHDASRELIHPAVGVAVLAQLSVERQRELHVDLAMRCVGAGAEADAARHHFAAGNSSLAAEAAERAATTSDAAERAEMLTLAVDARGVAASPRLLLDAAAALIVAQQTTLAERTAARVVSDEPELVAEAFWLRSQCAWLDGDVPHALQWCEDGLRLVAGTRSAIEGHLVVEQASYAVRVRVGDVAVVELARAANALADELSIDRAKARNALGLALAHTASPGWEKLYQEAGHIARAEGDSDQECAAAYWAVSAYGLYGPLQRAIEVGEAMLVRTEELGLRRWNRHFFVAYAVHRLGTGQGDSALIDGAYRFLEEDPLFRNRSQLELALAVGLIDAGRSEQAERVIADGFQCARNDEDRSLLTVAAAELALVAGRWDDVVAAVDRLAGLQRGFFGMNAAAEAAAIYAAFASGEEFAIPRLTSDLMPSLAAVNDEHDALDAWRSQRASVARTKLIAAATSWSQRGFPRFAARAWFWASELAEKDGLSDAARQHRRAAHAVCAEFAIAPVAALLADRELQLHRAWMSTVLTARERQVLELVGAGKTSPAIAALLRISSETVDTHVEAACSKLGAVNRTQAAALISGPA